MVLGNNRESRCRLFFYEVRQETGGLFLYILVKHNTIQSTFCMRFCIIARHYAQNFEYKNETIL